MALVRSKCRLRDTRDAPLGAGSGWREVWKYRDKAVAAASLRCLYRASALRRRRVRS